MENQVFAKVIDGKVVSFPVRREFIMAQKSTGKVKTYFQCVIGEKPEITTTQKLINEFNLNNDKVYVTFKVVDKTPDEILSFTVTTAEFSGLEVESIKKAVSGEIEARLNIYAKTKYDFNDMIEASSFVNSTVKQYKDEAKDCISFRDKAWQSYYSYFAKVASKEISFERTIDRIVTKILNGN